MQLHITHSIFLPVLIVLGLTQRFPLGLWWAGLRVGLLCFAPFLLAQILDGFPMSQASWAF